jgi:hypothetical protein
MPRRKQTENELEQVGEEVVKKKRHVGNPAMTGDAINIDPNENTKYIMQGLRLLNLPNIDLNDPVAVQNRIDEYFSIVAQNGNKPTVAGLGLALNGMDRRRLWEIRTGNYGNTRGETTTLPKSVTDIIKKTYKFMEELWENYMQNGKINPVSGIFLGKNNYGYVDKQDVVITPNVQPESDFSAEDIRKRYALPDA